MPVAPISPTIRLPATARLLAVFVAGLLIGSLLGGGAVVGDLPGGPNGDASVDPDDPPTSVTTATANTGWVHEVATGPSRTLTANVSVAHRPDETVNASLEAVGDGVYRLRVDVVDAEAAKRGTPDCPTGSTVEAAASLPTGYERLVVVVDGRTAGSLANDGDTDPDPWTFA